MNSAIELLDWCHRRNLPLRQRHLDRLLAYLDKLERVGAHTNLTRILDRPDMLRRHLADSLLFGPLLGSALGLRVADLGCGAGLPSVPLAIVYGGWQVSAVDSVLRKVDFLNELRRELPLSNLHPLHERLETLGHDPDHRESYDACCARACGPLPAVLEYAFPLLRPGGRLVVATTRRVYDEAGSVDSIVTTLGGGRHELRPYRMDGEAGRNFVHLLFDKEGQSPSKYPRKPKQMAKKPLS